MIINTYIMEDVLYRRPKSKTKLLEWSLLIEQGSFMFVTVEKDVHIFVQDVNPGQVVRLFSSFTDGL